MAVPKRKSSKARKNKRRSNVWKLEAPAMCRCTQCGSFKLPHNIFKSKFFFNVDEIPPKTESSAAIIAIAK